MELAIGPLGGSAIRQRVIKRPKCRGKLAQCVSAGPAGTMGLHALSQSACDTKCELICSPGEKLVSVTCPGGAIHIEEIDDSNSASCIRGSGPALALCMRQ
jgi:hypothetical protein